MFDHAPKGHDHAIAVALALASTVPDSLERQPGPRLNTDGASAIRKEVRARCEALSRPPPTIAAPDCPISQFPGLLPQPVDVPPPTTTITAPDCPTSELLTIQESVAAEVSKRLPPVTVAIQRSMENGKEVAKLVRWPATEQDSQQLQVRRGVAEVARMRKIVARQQAETDEQREQLRKARYVEFGSALPKWHDRVRDEINEQREQLRKAGYVEFGSALPNEIVQWHRAPPLTEEQKAKHREKIARHAEMYGVAERVELDTVVPPSWVQNEIDELRKKYEKAYAEHSARALGSNIDGYRKP